jgi:hypothetical protein
MSNKAGKSTRIQYTDVEKIGGPGLSRGAKIGIGVGVAVVAVRIVIGIKVATFHLNFGKGLCCP